MIDIMDGRKDTSDLCWIMKDYESKIPFFNNYKSKELVKQSIIESNDFKYDLKLLSDQLKKPESELLKEAYSILDGMSHNIGMNSIRLMGYTLSKIIKRIYRHLYVDAGQMEKLRNCFGQSHVVLLPTHRSYADFLLMSYVMFHFNLPMPVIAAAMDFMQMRIVGELLRGCGAFFIRRSFATDGLYWAVFSHYIKALIGLAQEPLEFFIEGTRSRVNKSLHPKVGLLGIVLELWLSGCGATDVVVVPISISYDRVLEESLYAWELLGVPKPKESTSGLLRVRHVLDDNYGNIYFNAGDPISLSKLTATYGIRRMHHNLELRFKPRLFDNEKRFLRELASLIVATQQRNLFVPDWAILVMVLLHCGLIQSRGVALAELVHLYSALESVLLAFQTKLASVCGQGPEDAVRGALELHKRSVRKDGELIALFGCEGDLCVTANTSAAQMDALIVDRIHLGNCRNPLLFHVARESILLSRIMHGPPNGKSAITDDFLQVLDLMSREFIYDGCGQSNLDAAVARLSCSNLLNDQWQPDTGHASYCVLETAVHVHLLAYTIYGYIFIADNNKLELNGMDKCKYVQKRVIDILRSRLALANAYLEICSLDMVRNGFCRFNEISKSQSIADLQGRIASLERCLPATVRQQLVGICWVPLSRC